MNLQHLVLTLVIALSALYINPVTSQREVFRLFKNCRFGKPDFDPCVKKAFNALRPWFKTGLPELNVAPFDPHKAAHIVQYRGDKDGLAGYKLQLSNVSEYGWAISEVTKYKTDYKHDRIIYSQYFPEKSLDGEYEFESKLLGSPWHTKGIWNLTLYEYSQTTTVTRVGGPGGLLKVRVEIDKIGDMKLHISDLFHGAKFIESIADFFINTLWQPSFPFIKPLINDLVSTAFTDIFNESFRYFPLHEVIRNSY
ncbi:uncharacterized protein LOC131684687 [Topomyia yanbarensis]|uniref:uncharacterized protein LOC131684687 n=1 Tax=Topomyia yanbarensis TaxID=2498891 RepID=UPI00273C41AF|nr:uncharacterized protein LOC131684687 [Topomyia yanbarensis]XP_058823758.1 uncharacterized protein LOC131684687 [Topomyia yanbarensis]